MERIFHSPSVLSLVSLCISAPGLAQGNLLPDPGFEEGAGSPPGWQFAANADAEGACRLDHSLARSGQQSVRIDKTSGRGFLTLTLAERVPVEPGTEYELRGWVHIPESSFGSLAYFIIKQFPADSQQYLPPNIFSESDQRAAIKCRPGEWSIRSTVFTARPTAAFVEVGLVTTGNPFVIHWDDLYLGPPIPPKLDLPKLTPETLAPQEEVYRKLAERREASGRVMTIDGQPTLLINGEATPPILHLMCFWRPFTSYNGDFGRAGVHIHVCPIPLAPYLADGSHIWKGKGEYDFAKADEVLLYALRADPDGYLVPDLCLIGAYPGWGDEHPDEVCQDINGLKAIGKSVHNTRYGNELTDPKEFWCPSYYSEIYRRDGQEVIGDYVAHLRQTPLGKAVVGFSITGGDDGQFTSWRRSGPEHEPDYSPAARRGFVAFLHERYGSEEGLQQAWHDPGARLDGVELPSPDERTGGGRTLRDPTEDVRLADFDRFLAEGTCDMVRGFAGAAKEAAGKPVFCTTYWGAHLMGPSHNHLASRRLMNTPEIDIVHAPAGYGPWRRPGRTGSCHTTPGSLRLHNKVCLQELDLRTFTRGYRDEAYGYFLAWAKDLEEFRAINRREMGMMMSWGMGAWYYDMAGGWFHDDGIMEDIRSIHDSYQAGLASVRESHPDVAVFADEESGHWIHEGAWQVMFSALNRQREAMALSGVPYDLYVTDDLTHPDLAEYKVYVFLNCYRLTDQQVRFIESDLKRDGRTLVWMYAPGYIADGGLALEQTSRLVGMKLGFSQEWTSLEVEAVEGTHPLAHNLLPLEGVSTNAAKFWVDDPETVALGRYVSGGEVAIAAREFEDWRSVYVAAPGGLGPGLLNNIARWSGAYFATDPGDAVYMNSRLLCVHGVTGGKRTFHLPRRAIVTDAMTGEVMAYNRSLFQAEVPLQQTRWFRLD